MQCSAETLQRVKANDLPKGNLFDIARAAGMLAAKNTDRLIPHCHPVRIDSLNIECRCEQNGILIEVTARSLDKTGIEMEVLTAASVAALTIYDLLKPIDSTLEINSIKLTNKTGGKESYLNNHGFTAQIVIVSDRVFAGKATDKSGQAIIELLQKYNIQQIKTEVVPDEPEKISALLTNTTADLIIFTGGTGVSPRDLTPQAVLPFIHERLPGVEEAMRSYGQSRNQKAMLSRSIAAFFHDTLVLCVPGSVSGARESLLAILPGAFHAIEIRRGLAH